MKFFYVFFVFIICLTAVHAQEENSPKQNQSPVRASFYQDFLDFYSGRQDTTRLDIFIQVPYTQVQFIKTDKGFEASYTVTISVFDEDKEKLLAEKIWSEKIDSREFTQTISKNNFNLSYRSFFLLPAKYTIRSAVEDKESKKTYSAENVFTVRDLSAKPSISDIMLISGQKNVSDSSSAADSLSASQVSNSKNIAKILPNISRNISAKRDGIPFFFEVYSNAAQQVKFNYQILDNDKKAVFEKDTTEKIDSGKTQIFYTISDLDLGLGNYQLKVSMKGNDNGNLASVTKTFVSRWIGVPSVIKDLDKAISELVYIASGEEISYIEKADNQAEKIKRYMEFWKKKDPTPGTEENQIFDEYYRRISFANENFSHYIEGWRTDRGMVYIILGAPNNVDRHPFDYDSKPYEIWEYYNLNKQFVFLDETGFGDYRLISPLEGDLYRFR